MTSRPAILGRLLLDGGAITADALASALDEQRGSGRRLGEILVGRGLADGELVARSLAGQLGLAYAAPPLDSEPSARALVRPALARDRRVLPLAVSAKSLRLAMVDPLDLRTVDDVRFQAGRRVEPVVASEPAVVRGLARAYGEELAHLIDALPARPGDPRVGPSREGIEEASRSAPVVRLVDHLLRRAVDERASDIHIEERAGDVRVRFRVDGLLREVLELPRGARRAVLSRPYRRPIRPRIRRRCGGWLSWSSVQRPRAEPPRPRIATTPRHRPCPPRQATAETPAQTFCRVVGP